MSQERKTPGRWSASESLESTKDTSSLASDTSKEKPGERLGAAPRVGYFGKNAGRGSGTAAEFV